MKCERCFFCTSIGAGVYADFPVKYCKYTEEYKFPFVITGIDDNGVPIQRRLDFRKIADCKIWHEVGCDIHPSTVRKAKNDYFKRLAKEGRR